MIRKLTADYIFPLNKPPLKNGMLIVNEDGSIIELLSDVKNYSGEIESFKGFLCPGFVNSHCHLELSYLKGLIPPHAGLDVFIDLLEYHKGSISDSGIIRAMEKAEKEMVNNGIVAVGDISNKSHSFGIKEKGKLLYHTFIEVFGSDATHSEVIFNNALALVDQVKKNTHNNNVSLVPHSAYSVSVPLLEKIKVHAQKNQSILSIHHQENEDENLFFLNKTGKIVSRMKRFGVDISGFQARGLRPLETIAGLLPVENSIQLVHNTVSEKRDVEFAINYFNNPCFCMCPNANLYIENKLPDIELIYESGAMLTIGTDGYASNNQLSILEEIKTISLNYPDIPLAEILKWSSYNGALFLGIDSVLGSFEKSKKPGVNLIENVDIRNIRLGDDSAIKVII